MKYSFRNFFMVLLILTAGLATPVVRAAAANEIDEVLEEARNAYGKGYLKLAATRMNQALTLVHALETQRARKVFPAPLAGWKTGEDNAALNKFKSMGIGAVLATGLTYTAGEQSVQIVLIQKPSSPQPLFDLVLAGLLAPRVGMEKIPVQGYTAHYLCKKSLPTECDIALPVDADYVLLLNGKHASRETLLSYANAVRFDLLKEFR